MGWFRIGDDLLGDGPADLFQSGLAEFVSANGKPEWREFLDSMDAALGSSHRLRAVFEGEAPELRSDPGRASGPLKEALVEIVAEIAEEYRVHREREATLTEIVGTARFALGGMPEKYIQSQGPVPHLEKLVLE